MEVVWTAVAGGLVTLVGVLVQFWLSSGGRRRRLRREIQEELGLLKVLGPEHEQVATRIRVRVADLLAEYEPDPVRPRSTKAERAWAYRVIALEVLAGALITGLVAATTNDVPDWAVILVGPAIMGAGALLGFVSLSSLKTSITRHLP